MVVADAPRPRANPSRRVVVAILALSFIHDAEAERVLSVTIVGDGPENRPAVSQTATVGSGGSPESGPSVLTSPELKPVDSRLVTARERNPVAGLLPAPSGEVAGGIRLSLSRDRVTLRSSPGSTDTTDLVFDPIGSSFSLTGYQNSLALSTRIDNTFFGLRMSEGEAHGSVRARLENPNLRFIDTDVNLSKSSVGLFVGGSSRDESGSSRPWLGLERSKYEVRVSNDYRHGLFYGVPSVERSYRSTDLVVGLGHDHDAGSGLGFFIDQSYRLPIDDGFGFTGSAVSVGVNKDLGPGSGARASYRPAPRRCRGIEVFASDSVSSLSGSSSEQNVERTTDYRVESALGWDGSGLGTRYRFEADSGCGILWAGYAQKVLTYGTGYIEQLQPVVYTDPFESTGTLTLGGVELGLGRQVDLSSDTRGRGYLFGGATAFVGSGDVTAVSQFGSNREVTRSSSEAVLVGLRLGSGYERSIGTDRYLFYEMSVSRYDARPFGTDLRGVEVGLDLGIGL